MAAEEAGGRKMLHTAEATYLCPNLTESERAVVRPGSYHSSFMSETEPGPTRREAEALSL